MYRVMAGVLGLIAGIHAQAQIAVSGPPVPGGSQVRCTSLQLSQEVPCPDSTLFFWEGSALVERAFHAHDFKKLDEIFEQWSTGHDRFPDGRWKLTTYGNGLAGLFDAWGNWSGYVADIKRWQAERPDSFAAKYVEAVYWRRYAWKARGSGYARTIAPESWEIFRERLAAADKVLEAIHDDARRHPSWYPLKISVLIDLNAPTSEVRKVFLEGAQRFPEYHDIYFTMARRYEPKWGGSEEQYAAFAEEAAKIAKFEGPGMYARLYWLVDYSDSNGGIPFDMENPAGPVWAKLHAGFDELMRRYPSSIHNLNHFASVACRSRDANYYRQLRTKIEGYVAEDAFGIVSVDACDRRHTWKAE